MHHVIFLQSRHHRGAGGRRAQYSCAISARRQISHQMIIIQWQKDAQGKPEKVAVWPPAAANKEAFLCPAH